MPPMPTSVTLLNNYCQKNPTNTVSYVEASAGPADKIEWTVTCKVNGEMKGQGVAANKAAAKEAAAKQALQALGQA